MQFEGASPDAQRITELVRAVFGGRSYEFRPVAFYNENLDTIQVLTKDCSYCAVWNRGLLTIHEQNHTEGDEKVYCGFEIECVRALCGLRGYEGRVNLVDLLDAVEVHDTGLRDALQIARKLVQQLADKTVVLPH